MARVVPLGPDLARSSRTARRTGRRARVAHRRARHRRRGPRDRPSGRRGHGDVVRDRRPPPSRLAARPHPRRPPARRPLARARPICAARRSRERASGPRRIGARGRIRAFLPTKRSTVGSRNIPGSCTRCGSSTTSRRRRRTTSPLSRSRSASSATSPRANTLPFRVLWASLFGSSLAPDAFPVN